MFLSLRGFGRSGQHLFALGHGSLRGTDFGFGFSVLRGSGFRRYCFEV